MRSGYWHSAVPALGKRLVDSAALIRTGKAEVRLDFDAKEKSI